MTLQIEPKTRQWIGLLVVSGFVIAMIWTGRIPVTVYQHWEGLLVGALFYHVIRMLNQSPDAGKMVGDPLFLPQMQAVQSHFGGLTDMVNPQVKSDPTQHTQEKP